jgi:amino acid adenylation domain-containing protein
MSSEKPGRVIFDSRLIAERDYWLGRLSGGAARPSLSASFGRRRAGEAARRTLKVEFPEALTGRLIKATKDSPFLLYTILMTALKVCLHKYTGEQLIVVGSPSRRQEGDSGGGSPNALAIADEVDGQLSFRQHLAKVRETLTEAYARQSYPFPRLLQDLGLAGEERGCPLFDVALVLENIHHELPVYVTNDITLNLRRSAEGIGGEVVYEGALYGEEAVARFAAHFLSLLGKALENVDRPTRELVLLTEEEQHQILSTWNDTAAAYPQECVHRLFEARAAETPSATAVIYKDEHLTYAELNARANQLARRLRDRGVEPETIVGVRLSPTPRMIVAVVAVLKSGGAYLPLDPSLPQARIAHMLQDSGARLVLTEQSLSAGIDVGAAVAVCLDAAAEEEEIGLSATENLPGGARLGNLAYVIYTSGSTGQPKGVMAEHRGVCNMAQAQATAFGIAPGTRLLQFASLAFDASVSEIFTVLVSGATLCLEDREIIHTPAGLTRAVEDLKVTAATLPPALLAVLPDDCCPMLGTVVSAGESCPAAVVERWSRGRRFINAYGPTEATVCATLGQYEGRFDAPPPIGRPLANAQVYLLDRYRQLVPAGVPGELCVGGAGVTRGYFNRPGLTAERYVPHPFSRTPGARLYRTGDNARHLPDGQIEFLGRLDDQIKIRGFRVEPGEIEAALRRHEAVLAAVVVNRQTGQDARLVAYVIPSGDAPQAAVLRDFLKEHLPEYMTPAQFVMLPEFPLNASGKVDRQKLPAPESGETYEPPRTQSEQTLADIWKEVLGVERVGINDNFFSLGGHSLMVGQAISRISKELGVDLPVRALFEAPTVAQLNVAVLKRQADEMEEDGLSDILAELEGLSNEEAEALLARGEDEGGRPDAGSAVNS